MTMTNIEINEDKGFIEYSIKVFTDDFENLTYEFCGDKKFNDDNKTCISNLINQAFEIRINNKKLNDKVLFIDLKKNYESHWFTFRIPIKTKIKQISIVNNLFFNKFVDQNNLIIIKYNNKEEGFQIKKHNQSVTINY